MKYQGPCLEYCYNYYGLEFLVIGILVGLLIYKYCLVKKKKKGKRK